MSKVITSTINGFKVPTICKENSGSADSWALGVKSEGMSKTANEIVGLRVFFGFGTDVNMGVAKASEIADSSGANTGMISKGKKVSAHYVAIVAESAGIAPTEATIDHYAEALELCCSEHGSLNSAYAQFKVPSETDLEKQVANLYKWADKNGIARELVLAEVTRQVGV